MTGTRLNFITENPALRSFLDVSNTMRQNEAADLQNQLGTLRLRTGLREEKQGTEADTELAKSVLDQIAQDPPGAPPSPRRQQARTLATSGQGRKAAELLQADEKEKNDRYMAVVEQYGSKGNVEVGDMLAQRYGIKVPDTLRKNRIFADGVIAAGKIDPGHNDPEWSGKFAAEYVKQGGNAEAALAIVGNPKRRLNEKGFDFQTITGPDGTQKVYRLDRTTGDATPTGVEGMINRGRGSAAATNATLPPEKQRFKVGDSLFDGNGNLIAKNPRLHKTKDGLVDDDGNPVYENRIQPNSPVGKIKADLDAGIITQEEYDFEMKRREKQPRADQKFVTQNEAGEWVYGWRKGDGTTEISSDKAPPPPGADRGYKPERTQNAKGEWVWGKFNRATGTMEPTDSPAPPPSNAAEAARAKGDARLWAAAKKATDDGFRARGKDPSKVPEEEWQKAFALNMKRSQTAEPSPAPTPAPRGGQPQAPAPANAHPKMKGTGTAQDPYIVDEKTITQQDLDALAPGTVIQLPGQPPIVKK